MIREIIVPKVRDLVLQLPAEMVGRRVEIIAFAVDEPADMDKTLTHFVSEAVLAKDWLNEIEDAAWQDL